MALLALWFDSQPVLFIESNGEHLPFCEELAAAQRLGERDRLFWDSYVGEYPLRGAQLELSLQRLGDLQELLLADDSYRRRR